VWDADSARLVEEAGFKAVATSSAAMAAALGHEDDEDTPPGEMFAAIARITRVVSVPVTADVERGYGLKAGRTGRTARRGRAAGCTWRTAGAAG
jgi:2-methylisocitrate lyase-like PEP mutase family enzyme